MNTQQLTEVLNQDHVTRPIFMGVFASDSLPEKIDHFPFLLIANSDPSTDSGSHWLAFYISSQEEGEFFDSYGNQPSFYSHNFTKFMERHSREIIFNSKHIQSNRSDVCGQYCLFFLIHRARATPMENIIRLFSPDKDWNDLMVDDFISKHFAMDWHSHQRFKVKCLVQQRARALYSSKFYI